MTNTRRPALALLAASALLAGCGPAKHISIDLRPVSVTVPRIVTPAKALVPVAPQEPPAPLPPAPPVVTQLPPLPTSEPSLPPVVQPRLPACPRAGQFDVPDLTASLLLNHPPAPATYTQALSGTFATTSGGGSLGGTVTETVKAIGRATSGTGQVVDTWSIARVDAARKTTSVELYRLVHAATSALATPAGIYLVGLAWHDPVRGVLSFQASGNGLYVLPSPVALSTPDGAQYAGLDTDASTLTTLALVRNVTGKKRVDLCGQLVDTYTVEMHGVLTTPDSQRQITWTQQLATAYGSLPVQDVLTLANPAGDFTWTQTRTGRALPAPVAP